MSQIHMIDSNTLQEWLDNDEAVLIDVREPAEYKSMSIENAINLPLSIVSIDKVHMPEHKHKKLVFHCQAGKRSAMACEKLMQENPKFDIWDLEGGINAWNSLGLDVNKGKKLLALDRQIQLTASLFLLIGLLLSNVSSIGHIIIFIVCVGLAVAGITGQCLMLKILARMPWNKQ